MIGAKYVIHIRAHLALVLRLEPLERASYLGLHTIQSPRPKTTRTISYLAYPDESTHKMAAPPPGAKRRHTTDKKLGERRRERVAGSSRDASEEGEFGSDVDEEAVVKE